MHLKTRICILKVVRDLYRYFDNFDLAFRQICILKVVRDLYRYLDNFDLAFRQILIIKMSLIQCFYDKFTVLSIY